MAATLAMKATAMGFQVPDQIDPLHRINRLGDEALANDLCATEILLC